jgi:hypothetical protein
MIITLKYISDFFVETPIFYEDSEGYALIFDNSFNRITLDEIKRYVIIKNNY